MLFSLCACDMLDIEGQKLRQAKYTDKTHETIIFRDAKYIKYQNEDLDRVYFENSCYVTEADVPALLASQYGNYIAYNDAVTILRTLTNDNSYIYFIREDFVDEFENEVLSGVDHYCYFSYDSGERAPKILSDAQVQAINEALLTEPPETKESLSTMCFAYVIYKCDKTFTIMEVYCNILYDNDGKYYLDTEFSTPTHDGLREIPSKFNYLFDDIITLKAKLTV